MRSKNGYSLFLIFFFIIIFFVPVFWFARGEVPEQKSLLEGKIFVNFPPHLFLDFKTAIKRIVQGRPEEAKKYFDKFVDRTFQENIEQSASDQFPLRFSWIQVAKETDRKIIELAYLPLDDPAIPADFRSGLYIMRDMPVLIDRPSTFSDAAKEIIDQRIANYAQLINENPDVDFYVFYHQRISSSEYHPLNQYFFNPDLGQAFAYFEEHKPDDLVLGKFMLTSFEDHIKYYFSTDHHWNVYGWLKAYEIIHELLSRNFSDISPVLQHDEIYTFPDIKYLGSSDRITYYPLEGEDFSVPLIDLPPYRILYFGQDVEFNSHKAYLSGSYSTLPYVDHYQAFYGRGGDLFEYYFDNNVDRNLLIIGSSFDLPLQPLLAYHYRQTFVVDLREFKDFSLSQFRSNHHVDDVLIIGDNSVAFEDLAWMINP